MTATHSHLIPPDAPRIAAVAMVKNECDIIELFVRINARWAAHFYIHDDNSSDATTEILERMAAESYPLTVIRSDEDGYDQSACITAMVRQAAASGQFDYIFPIDADEFVQDAAVLFEAVPRIPSGHCGSLAWATLIPKSADAMSASAPLFDHFARRRTEKRLFSKCILPVALAERGTVSTGNHTIFLNGEIVPAIPLPVELYHAPVRSKEQVIAKAVIGSHKKSIKRNRLQGESFQWDQIAATARNNGFELSDLGKR